MTRDEIYDHLAQVYLGKRSNPEKKGKKKFDSWLRLNIVITAVIFLTAFCGFTAFLVNRNNQWQNNILFALHNGPVRIPYNLNAPYPQVKTFTLTIPKMDVSKYRSLQFSIRGLDEGAPGIVKITLRNQKQEVAVYYVQGVAKKWKDVAIPFEEFEEITDWSNVTDVSFVLEAWNTDNKKGVVLIDNVSFAS